MPRRESSSPTANGSAPYDASLQDKLPSDQPSDSSHSQAPEIQQMYSLNMPVSAIRTKMRQEFERHRYVQQLKTVDVLLFNSHQEYQVRCHPLMPTSSKLTKRLLRKPSTSGSNSPTSSSTSAQRRTLRLHCPRTSSKVSSRYDPPCLAVESYVRSLY